MTDAHGVARDQLRAFIERIERLESEKKTIADDIKDIYGEAKGTGFDTKVLRKLISIRKQDRDERMEQEAILDMYMIALGMIDGDYADDEPRQSAPAQRQPSAPLRSDAGLSIVTKHTEITASVGSPAVLSSLTTRETEESVVSNPEMDRSTKSSFAARSEAAEKGREAIPAGPEGVDLNHAGASESLATHSPKTANESLGDGDGATVAPNGTATSGTEVTAGETAPHSDQPLTGGDHEVTSIAERDRDIPTSNTGEGTALSALPANSGLIIESVPPAPMKRPDFASCFPELSNAAYARARDEIQANGICAPIIRQGDVILDGWDRYNISRELGFNYPVQEYTGTDVLLDVIEMQRTSRNFTPAQEKKIAADLAKEFPRRADEIMASFGLAEAIEAAE
jgi:uncharacterized protein (UPF0335 family)